MDFPYIRFANLKFVDHNKGKGKAIPLQPGQAHMVPGG
jgi:hypothetical protein